MSQHGIEGYVLCDTGSHTPRWVRDEVARVTGDLCPECFSEAGGKRLLTLELVGRGMRAQISRHPAPRKARTKKISDTKRARIKQNAKARDNARKRLAAMLPDLFEIVLADERGRLGLEPWPVANAVRANDPSIDLGFAELVAELNEHGMDTR